MACEFSGIVRDAFIAKGCDAVSCDLLPSERPGPHWQGDVRDLLDGDWDLMIAHPPCTYLSRAGNRWKKDRDPALESEALSFVHELLQAPIHRIALENPIGRISSAFRQPEQMIQPWMFGHGETKATCLWLKNLPVLRPTDIVEGRHARITNMGQSLNRARLRSITFQGIADAMADQWGWQPTLKDDVYAI